MELNLKGKYAVITGGSKGIGYAIAEGLAAEGVNLVLLARNLDLLEKKSETLQKKYGVNVYPFSVDVTDKSQVGNMYNYLTTITNKVHILINNAGTGSEETILNSEEEKWYYYWDLHVMSAIRLSKLLVPLMAQDGEEGVIINTASICAKQPLYYEPIYNTTKAALVMLSKCLANELISYNIRVNTINPGLVLTEDWLNTAKKLTKSSHQTVEEYLNNIAKDTPIKRFAMPEEVANFCVFLCSEKASYCVGSSYYIDGGWLSTII